MQGHDYGHSQRPHCKLSSEHVRYYIRRTDAAAAEKKDKPVPFGRDEDLWSRKPGDIARRQEKKQIHSVLTPNKGFARTSDMAAYVP